MSQLSGSQVTSLQTSCSKLMRPKTAARQCLSQSKTGKRPTSAANQSRGQARFHFRCGPHFSPPWRLSPAESSASQHLCLLHKSFPCLLPHLDMHHLVLLSYCFLGGPVMQLRHTPLWADSRCLRQLWYRLCQHYECAGLSKSTLTASGSFKRPP